MTAVITQDGDYGAVDYRTSGSVILPQFPKTPTEGDLMVAFLAIIHGDTGTFNSITQSWNLLSASGGNYVTTTLAWKKATASETAPQVNVGFTGSPRYFGAIALFHSTTGWPANPVDREGIGGDAPVSTAGVDAGVPELLCMATGWDGSAPIASLTAYVVKDGSDATLTNDLIENITTLANFWYVFNHAITGTAGAVADHIETITTSQFNNTPQSKIVSFKPNTSSPRGANMNVIAERL